MYNCHLCSKVNLWPDSLRRHVTYKHGAQESNSERQQQVHVSLSPQQQQGVQLALQEESLPPQQQLQGPLPQQHIESIDFLLKILEFGKEII
jgi:hypothetical protein